MKRLVIFLLLLIIFIPIPASAHVLKAEKNISAVLHMPPDDNPIVGETTRFSLSFGDTKNMFSLANCDCSVHVLKDENEISTLKLRPIVAGATLKGITSYQFPTPGVYELEVHGHAADNSYPDFTLQFMIRATGTSQGDTYKGTQALIIGAGALVIVGMLAYLNMSSGGRYVTADPPKKQRRK